MWPFHPQALQGVCFFGYLLSRTRKDSPKPLRCFVRVCSVYVVSRWVFIAVFLFVEWEVPSGVRLYKVFLYCSEGVAARITVIVIVMAIKLMSGAFLLVLATLSVVH